MWVGTQTSQVEIKLSLKACQVRKGHTKTSLMTSGTTCPSVILGEAWEGALGSPAGLGGLPRPLSSSPGVHPAHTL